MGRKKQYQTVDEQKAARKRWNDSWYQKNKDKIMEKYYELRKNILPDNREVESVVQEEAS
jgi:hypothetical protein